MTNDDRGATLLAQGSRRYGQAARLIAVEGPLSEARTALAGSLPLLRSAMNWLEDTSAFETAHQRLDAAGALQRQHFKENCRFTFKDGSYFQECAVSLAHNRVGMSVGAIIRESKCSICELDPDDCEHIAGRVYDGEECVRIITRADLEEVSLVGRPNFPDARIESMSIDTADLRAELGERFEVGMDVFCDRCLKPCDGVARPFEGSSHSWTGESDAQRPGRPPR